jgi:hypothetical protein
LILRSPLNWILAIPDLFVETLNELDKKAREVMLFQFKKEIERYHEENYLSEELEISELNKKNFSRDYKAGFTSKAD